MNFYFKTLGCKVNQYETQALTEALLKSGHTANPMLPVDAVLINSCTVTAESDRKTRQALHSLKKKYPAAVMVLTGCMVQAFPEKAKELTDADIVIGNRNVKKIVEAINDYKKQKKFCVSAHNIKDKYNCLTISEFNERTRAFMKIEDGCDRYCTYCIIPKARGYVRSRSLESIKAEAKRLADNGYSEIVLVGINLSSFGQNEGLNLCDAVEAVSEIEGIKRIRLGSLEPDLITLKMLVRLAAANKFCPQFHLSLQSGCDKTLKRMNRHYDTAYYAKLVGWIRDIFNNAAITTDIMVGFAGETDDEFNESLEFVKKIEFARAHIFAYSRRTGTIAAALADQVEKKEKERRANIMASVSKDCERRFIASQIGMTAPVLFETANNDSQSGYTPNYTRVLVKSEKPLTGHILNVLIKETYDDYCVGEPV
ncbi:MAG: tRNA (N(6)-L-threonylcarbamoyladenosine(37)-C(2))-methylthiotransferase MtaB [Clostridia bacterium]|nr:tRNA (N(6)-L-threonylcarbamoyladenosine(37)-C(2))-methylthiotransferase MtaB [Clostridia bacterium]